MRDHPMKGLEVLVYLCDEAKPLDRHRAFFDSDTTPIFFRGRSHAEAHERAVAFRDKAVSENEETFRLRVATLEKGRAKRAKRA